MKFHREANGILVVSITLGEEIRANVQALAASEKIVAAQVSAVGAVKDPELGFYNLSERQYQRRVFPGTWELITLQGNIALLDGQPFLHAHAVISEENFQALAGHFFDARVGVVLEMFIISLPTPLRRIYREDIGVPCWEPGE